MISLGLAQVEKLSLLGNTIPIFKVIDSDTLTPISAYLKLLSPQTNPAHANPNPNHSTPTPYSFLFESILGGEKIGRYSFIGTNPTKILDDFGGADPLLALEKELEGIKVVKVDNLPDFTGGAVGFISYDCVQYFEPSVKCDLRDELAIPDAVLMIFDTIVIFDHLHSLVKVCSNIHLPPLNILPLNSLDSVGENLDPLMCLNSLNTLDSLNSLDSLGKRKEGIRRAYEETVNQILKVEELLKSEITVYPIQDPTPAERNNEIPVSNIGKEGYKSFVNKIKERIVGGDVIQTVPSQRLKKKSNLHPFNAYRRLRSVNPSPYMFYLDCRDFQLVGASPEMLVKVCDREVFMHPIAGTRRRGKDGEEDEALARELIEDLKERSEHVMLVDLGRNDVNRVCEPSSVTVDSLMHIERYAHVMHIVSNVSGRLRDGFTQFDAFRSIFPAGTVSGAPKIKAMQLIYELEGEKRGVYAGAVGHFNYSGGLDTCIAIRTMLFKDGYIYLQAGGGIVYDSDPDAEYEETIVKLRSNVIALQEAEAHFAATSS